MESKCGTSSPFAILVLFQVAISQSLIFTDAKQSTPKLLANSLVESRQSLSNTGVSTVLGAGTGSVSHGAAANSSRQHLDAAQNNNDDNARFYLKKQKVLNLQDSGAQMLVRVDALLQHAQKLTMVKSAQSTLSLALSIAASENLDATAGLTTAQVEFWKTLRCNSEFLMGKV